MRQRKLTAAPTSQAPREAAAERSVGEEGGGGARVACLERGMFKDKLGEKSEKSRRVQKR